MEDREFFDKLNACSKLIGSAKDVPDQPTKLLASNLAAMSILSLVARELHDLNKTLLGIEMSTRRQS